MKQPVQHIIRNNHFWLSAQRCIFWEEEKTLILSDLHFGKTGHFRKAGVAVPQNIYKEDLQRLVMSIQHFNPAQLIIVGDLFHSHENKELDWFKRWRADLSSVNIQLVKGNHDILHNQWYEEAGMIVHDEELVINDFSFRHDPISEPVAHNSQPFSFTGHIHPGISIHGLAKQSLHFPCFYFTNEHCVLPAFSRFTGTHSIEPKKGDAVFAIVKDSVMSIDLSRI
jgi:DNA ligase-associated metallophosphoesterase